MKRTGRLRKQIITYTLAAAVVMSAAAAGSGFVSQAAYIQYDNIVVRDAPETGNVVEGLNAGVEVKVLDTANGSDGRSWNQIEYTVNGATHKGWVRADLMGESNPAGDSQSGNDTAGDTKKQDTTDSQTDNNGQTDDQEKKQDGNTSGEQKGADDKKEDNSAGTGTQDGADTSADVSEISGDGYLTDGEGSFLVRGKSLKISGDFSDSDIPEGFEKVQITYNGQEVNAAKAEQGEMFLLYLTGDEDGAFYILDTNRNCVLSFIRLTAGDASIILALPPQDEAISQDYEKTIFAVDEKDGISAYQFAQDPKTMQVDLVPEEYYYLYGMAEDGTYGWYLYDNGEKTFIRATADLSKNISGDSQETQQEQEAKSLEKMIVLGVGIVFLILLILVITFGVRCRRLKKKLPQEEPDPEEEEEDEEAYMTRAQRRRERRRYRHFMDEEEETFEDDMEDSAEEEESEEEGSQKETDEDVLVLDGEEYDWLDEEDDSDDPDAVLDEPPARKKRSETGAQKGSAKGSKPDGDSDDDWDDDLEFLDLK